MTPTIIKHATLYNCDCMELMKQYPNNHFDLAIVDPPYGIGAENHAGNSKNGWKQWDKKNWDNKIPSKEYFIELKRISCNQIIWGGNYFANLLDNSQCWLFWDKGQRDFSLADGELAWTSFQKSIRVFDMPRASAMQDANNKGGKIHPTQKPVKLYEWLLTNYAKQGDKILDTHLGSGSHAIACNNLGFELTACELDEDYFKASVERIKREAQQERLF